MSQGNKAAFARPDSTASAQTGLTKLEYMATAILQGMVASGYAVNCTGVSEEDRKEHIRKEMAYEAVNCAEALLKAMG